MEIRSYIEGIFRGWWLLLLVGGLAFWIGGVIGNSQPAHFMASTTILLNDKLLVNAADSSGVVQLQAPASYAASVAPPQVLSRIQKAYPWLSDTQLQNAITVTVDRTGYYLHINFTDIYSDSTVNITNFLARRFVNVQTANFTRQLDYYMNYFQQNILKLNNEIAQLNSQLQQLAPPSTSPTTTLPDPATQKLANEDQLMVNRDERMLYNDQQGLADIQVTRSLFKNAFQIIHPATLENELVLSVPPSPTLIRLIAVAIGLFVTVCLLIVSEYFHPFIRHRAELPRIVGLPVLAELPGLFGFEQKRLLEQRPAILQRRLNPLRLLCAVIGSLVIKNEGQTILITSPRRKRQWAPLLAAFLAFSGHQTLLIETAIETPKSLRRVKPTEPCRMATSTGLPLSFISKTQQSHLYVLPGIATLAQGQRLIDLLPQLQTTFRVIVIDAPPIDSAITHLLAPRATQTLVLVQKRRDSIKRLKSTRSVCQQLKVTAQCLLLK